MLFRWFNGSLRAAGLPYLGLRSWRQRHQRQVRWLHGQLACGASALEHNDGLLSPVQTWDTYMLEDNIDNNFGSSVTTYANSLISRIGVRSQFVKVSHDLTRWVSEQRLLGRCQRVARLQQHDRTVHGRQH